MSAKIETEVNKPYDYVQELSRSKDENKPILVDFYTNWCGWYMKLDAETYGNEVTVLLNKSLKLNAEKHTDLASE